MSAEDVCAAQFAKAHPVAAARVLEQLPGEEVAAFLQGAPAESAAEVIGAMAPAAGAECLGALPRNLVGKVVAAVPADAAARLLRRLPLDTRDGVLGACEQTRETLLRRLLTYPDDTAGGAADPQVMALPHDLTVGEARLEVRQHGGSVHHHLYVIDRTHRIVGVVHVRDLVRAEDGDPLTTIMEPADLHLPGAARLRDVAAHPAWQRLDALPVLDDAGRLIGILRHRDIRMADASSGEEPMVSTLLSLGELYWLALTSVIAGPAERREGGPGGS